MANSSFSSDLESSTHDSTSGSAKYIWRSLKTTDEQAAIQLGRRLLFQLEQRAEHGFPLKSKLFSTVIDDYIAYRERDHAPAEQRGMLKQIVRVSRFWREYAGELAVEAIDDKVMRAFIPWRRDYYSKFEKLPKNAKLHPTDTTLQWEMMLGKAIIRWADEQGLRENWLFPLSPSLPKRSVRDRLSRSLSTDVYGAQCTNASVMLGMYALCALGDF